MITREQLADLQPGDVVELAYDTAPDTITRGPLQAWPDGTLRLAGEEIRGPGGEVWNGYLRLLTVVSRAPRPLYVNHTRTEPVPGDVVRDADRADSVASWSRAVGSLGNHGWRYTGSANHWQSSMPTRLRLLVDGETGQVVQ